jgi:3-hydroxyisobutyryl-CoA hydrolase
MNFLNYHVFFFIIEMLLKKLISLNTSKIIIRMSSNSSTEVEFKRINQIGQIILNRPKQLNALNVNMIRLMTKTLTEFENDDNIKAIVVKGAGETAFCAGGDVKSIRELCLKGEIKSAMKFFGEEYALNYRISTCKKPYIALINGITMGGGVGVSVHGKYRIATEKTLFAMPETAIGFFADVGGSHFMSRLKDSLGLYLVLTGSRLKGPDVRRTGIATHYVTSSNLSSLENKLYEANNLNEKQIDAIINSFDEKVSGEYDTTRISKIFNESSLERIIKKLEEDNSDWAKQQLKLLEKMSPTSLKVSIKQLELGSKKTLKECFEMEYRIAQKFAIKSDFLEGVRALLVDKCGKPSWNPADYKEIDDKYVNWYFEFDSELDNDLFKTNGSKL